MKMETIDGYFSKIMLETITSTCREMGFDKTETKKFKNKFLGNMLVITQKIKLNLAKKGATAVAGK